MADYIDDGQGQSPEDEESPKKPLFPTKEEAIDGLKIFFGGLICGGLAFWLSRWALSYYDLGYFLVSLIALGIAAFILWALNKSMDLKDNRAKPAVIMVLIISFLFSILIGYEQHGSSLKRLSAAKVYKTESFTFTGKQFWGARKVFSKGKIFKIRVQNQAVNLINGEKRILLQPSVDPYVQRAISEGSPAFEGLDYENGGRSTVTIEWYE